MYFISSRIICMQNILKSNSLAGVSLLQVRMNSVSVGIQRGLRGTILAGRHSGNGTYGTATTRGTASDPARGQFASQGFQRTQHYHRLLATTQLTNVSSLELCLSPVCSNSDKEDKTPVLSVFV